ncbi:hypothetical protein DD238_008492 [Peronospora effusa]|uniref:Uncharacterized protein n=1 Tax=Peronospora effusa TaxID=542832 RepID=A0A3M6VAJ2_9STRA|nr:hypothetical protein DD238_008492 [Peronospora effusa]
MDPVMHTPDASASATLGDPAPSDGTPERPCAYPAQPRNKRLDLGTPVSATSSPPVVPDIRTGVVAIVAATSPDVATQAGAVMSPHASAKVDGGMRQVIVASKGEAGVMMVAAGLGESFAEEEEEEGELRPEIMTVPVVLVGAAHAGGLAVQLNSD